MSVLGATRDPENGLRKQSSNGLRKQSSNGLRKQPSNAEALNKKTCKVNPEGGVDTVTYWVAQAVL